LKRADCDLDALASYIAHDDPDAAARMALRVIEAVEELGSHPGIGRQGRVEGTRELIVSKTPYLVAYRVRQNEVEVLRALHGAQKWPDRL
jgi:toxin ParE1/3/4